MTQPLPNPDLTIIGRAERIDFVDLNAKSIPAKIDTGADISSVWASNIVENELGLQFELFAKGSDYYTGEVMTFPKGEYRLTRVANSFGAKELRYVIKLRIFVNQRTIKASFTLADRSLKIYPVLLGRRLLNGKFLVDVSQGVPLIIAEQKKLAKLHVELSEQEG